MHWTTTEREAHHLWAEDGAGATKAIGATEASRRAAPRGVGIEAPEEPVARDARTQEACGEGARTKRGTGRGSTSASIDWPNAWSGLKKKCASCAAAEEEAAAPEALRNEGQGLLRFLPPCLFQGGGASFGGLLPLYSPECVEG